MRFSVIAVPENDSGTHDIFKTHVPEQISGTQDIFKALVPENVSGTQEAAEPRTWAMRELGVALEQVI